WTDGGDAPSRASVAVSPPRPHSNARGHGKTTSRFGLLSTPRVTVRPLPRGAPARPSAATPSAATPLPQLTNARRAMTRRRARRGRANLPHRRTVSLFRAGRTAALGESPVASAGQKARAPHLAASPRDDRARPVAPDETHETAHGPHVAPRRTLGKLTSP